MESALKSVQLSCIESWQGAPLSVEGGGEADGVECVRTLAGSVSGCGDGSQSLKPWSSPPGGLLQTHALPQLRR